VKVAAVLANAAWAGAALRARRRFRAALDRPAVVQQALLASYLRDNQDTEIGRRYNFARILCAGSMPAVVESYQHSVPVCFYDELDPLIVRMARGDTRVLTAESVRRLAPSSGSSSAAKLLPQTATSQREFSRAVDAWMGDLYKRWPALVGGQAYWSVTPSVSFERIAAARLGASRDAARIPIGFDDDGAYLGGVRQRIVDSILAVPNVVRLIVDPEAFRYVTLLFLLRARELRLMSVWHPSFLLQLLDSLPAWFDRLVDDIGRGTITPPGQIPGPVLEELRRRLPAKPRAAAALSRFEGASPSLIWPSLTVVSCWGDGPAHPYAQRLRERLPRVAVEPKGLIATEGIVSIPFAGEYPAAVTSHFFEFIDAAGRARLAHQLTTDEDYDVVLTTGGGLYRYRLGDRVRVRGWLGAVPSIEFVGRSDRVSDRFGEKLSDQFVTSVLTELFASAAPPRFVMLTPETRGDGVAYTLLVEPSSVLPDDLEPALEAALRKNPHYAWCVDLGQLRPSRVVRVGPHAERAYLDVCVARGQRLGDIKPMALQRDGGWEAALGGSPT
jgi:hypothetical protein